VAQRLEAKLEKLKPDEADKRAELIAAHQPELWLDDAARRVVQLQLATHTLKPLHPDARGTQIYLAAPPDDPSLGTHSLRSEEVAADVVGNAAALDVFKLLKVTDGNGETLLAKLLRDDPAAAEALGDGDTGRSRAAALKQIAAPPDSPSSHTHGKQLYFPLPDGGYHLLAPLFPTSLVHHVHQHLQQTRFGEATVAARKARSEEKGHAQGYRDYPRLLVRAFGGTKPQNISQLNSERGGKAHHFSMLPPIWRSQAIRPIHGQKSVFADRAAFSSRKPVRDALKSLRDYFINVADVETNVRIRERAEALTEELIEQLILFTAEYRDLPAGWSNDDNCVLLTSQRFWLDAGAALHEHADPVDWPAEVARAFAAWLRSRLSSDEAKMQTEEYAEWVRLTERRLLAELKEWADEE
jgi:CRISPR-associated protein Csy1